MDKIGIFGGSFNPPHNVHVDIARESLKSLSLEVLYVVPNFIPPHKQHDMSVTVQNRMEMVELAFGDIQGVLVSDIEIKRGGKSYTFDTVAEIEKLHADRELVLVIGEDSFEMLYTWHRYEELLKKVDVFVVARGGVDFDIETRAIEHEMRFGRKVIVSSAKPVELASSEIRGRNDFGDVPPKVREYIESRGLYV